MARARLGFSSDGILQADKFEGDFRNEDDERRVSLMIGTNPEEGAGVVVLDSIAEEEDGQQCCSMEVECKDVPIVALIASEGSQFDQNDVGPTNGGEIGSSTMFC